MEKWKRRSIDLLTSIAFGGGENIGVVPYYPQKTEIGRVEEKLLRRSLPERKRISSRRLYAMLCELEGEKRANVHSITVVADGEVICECASPGYDLGRWHVAHSMTKSVTGMLIGALVDRGKLSLESKIVDIFPEVTYRDKRISYITVDHLLSMTAGVEFAEAGSVTESGWTEAFFNSAIRFAPGTQFLYNSMNSYILGRIAERVGGKSLGRLADELIFVPLGIKSYLWEKGPEGSEKGGWGLYLSAESWAKIGVMLLDGGVVGGKRMLSSKWLSEFTTVRAIPPSETGGFNYAYHCWVGRDGSDILFSGMLGQNLWLSPRNNIAVVLNSGNDELFQASPAINIIRKYLGGRIDDRINIGDARTLIKKQESFFDCRRWARPLDPPGGLVCLLGLRTGEKFDPRWQPLLGKYKLSDNGIGILPMVVRAMQNSMSARLYSIGLLREGERLVMMVEDCGESLRIPIGLYGYERSVLTVRGEKYLISSVGRAMENGEYRIEIAFTETASVRRITVTRGGNGVLIFKFGELPGEKLAESYLLSYVEKSRPMALALDIVERRFGRGSVGHAIHRSFNPTVIGVDASMPDCDRIVAAESEKRREEGEKLKFVRAVVDKFFGEIN